MKNFTSFFGKAKHTITAFAITLSSTLAVSNVATAGTVVVPGIYNGVPYTATITVTPTTVVPNNVQTSGYNYNLILSYNIKFTGASLPANFQVYTLQGTEGCGSNSNFFSLPLNGGVGTVQSVSNQWQSSNNGVAAAAVATPGSISCNNIQITINAPGISSQTVSANSTVSSLPLHLTTFTATATNNGINVDWTTAMEENVKSFSLQHSTDGINWDVIETAGAKGNASSENFYSYEDVNPAGGTNYYRLAENDEDGETMTFAAISADYKQTTATIRLFPNPNTTNNVHIAGLSENSGWMLQITSASGSSIGTTAITDGQVTLPEMPAGLYILRIINSNTRQVETVKYVKQ